MMSNFSEKSKMGNSNSSGNPWYTTYSHIESKHNEAYNVISEAISLEEQEKPYDALDRYKKGIEIIDDVLSIQVTCPDEPDTTWEKARLMIQKMKKTRAEVLMRINTLQPTLPPRPNLESPPSYEEAMSSSGSSIDGRTPILNTYSELAAALEDINIDPSMNMYSEVIYSHDGVKLYFISANGSVSSFSEPETLSIVLTKGENSDLPKAILQIGNWIYPLVPGASPCFRTEYGAFIFPDIYSNEQGASVGIILPSETDAEVYDLLENILHGIVGHQSDSNLHFNRIAESEEEQGLSETISKSIVTGAWYLSWGLVKGAEKLGDVMNYGTPKLISRLAPHHEPTDVNPKIIKGMQVAESTTKKVAKVTGYVAEQVGAATIKLGSFLAPHIQKQGTRLLSSGFNLSEEQASRKMKGVLTVAAGAVEGFSTIYNGLETSAGILGENLKNNSVKIVEHKYGTMAGEVAGDTLNTVGHVYTIGQNARIITPKGFVKKAAKGTGKGIVYEMANPKASTSSSNETTGL
ncbi:hypothetical protein HHI36_017245 [Cryptolaemus montrouzieri]|uniref:MIT domain-containing protein n=1 Tax=Cryptolaemus montrouzieri TaxID=559131 RepID=A0ABD2NMS3_9CUCU